MQGDEARVLLGFPPHCRPTPSEVKAAYKRKVWETHPDRFPVHEKPLAECNFKLVSEAYTFLQSGARRRTVSGAVGVPRTNGGRGNHAVIGIQFILIVVGIVAFGGSNAVRAYQRQKKAYPSHNPFLP